MNTQFKQSEFESWFEQHETKLRQYARALKSRDTRDFFSVDDFFSTMIGKLYMEARVNEGFLSMPDAYLMKTAWNEGLLMLRKQRRYFTYIRISVEMDDENREWILDRTSLYGKKTSNVTNNMQTLVNTVEDSIETNAIEHDTEALIKMAIASLPAKSQKIVTMLYAGKRPQEIAQAFGWNGMRGIPTHYMNQIRAAFAQVGLQTI